MEAQRGERLTSTGASGSAALGLPPAASVDVQERVDESLNADEAMSDNDLDIQTLLRADSQGSHDSSSDINER